MGALLSLQYFYKESFARRLNSNGTSTSSFYASFPAFDAPRSDFTVSFASSALHLIAAEMPRFGWFVGHLTLILCTIRYGFSYITLNYYSTWAKFSYRTAFVAAAATYGIVVYKAFRARARASARQQGSPIAMAGDENVQYLGT